ncbi:MAG: transposase [Deltaproteobacteria bacterium]|jgi:transposase-like protein|nr:transposase [Deltaproteobacteria bacterium]
MPIARHSHSVDFKIRAVFEAGGSQRAMKEVAAKLGVRPTQLGHWKKQAADVLETHWPNSPKISWKSKHAEKEFQEMERLVGKMALELEYYKKNWVARDRGAQSHGGERPSPFQRSRAARTT